MIGKLSYSQINEIINMLNTSNANLKTILSKYNNNDNISIKAHKLLSFCNDLDQYIINLENSVSMNQQADNVVNRLKDSNKL
ncbi:MAG: hypothetical protein IKO49_03110 [Bacilli bacterium]|nr:hypothetical protein [Bacilli bacterium]